MTNKKKVIVSIVAIITIATLIAIVHYGLSIYYVKFAKVSIEGPAYIFIDSDDNSDSIISKVASVCGNTPIDGFTLLAGHNNLDEQKETGKFEIKNGDNMHNIYRRIVNNRQTPVKVVIPPVRRVDQAVGAVSRQLMLDSAELVNFTEHIVYLEKIGYNRNTIPALFIPNTYEFYWDEAPERFMIRMMKEHRAFWNGERTKKMTALAEHLGYKIVETPTNAGEITKEEMQIKVSILASIVDEESNNTAEKPAIAGLYINRLKRGMLLQADPTVKFALGDFGRKRILNKDLEVDSPFNTYKYAGLPPGPIRIPTIQGIESVLNYKKHDYIYMCAKEDLSGTHNFAKTLSEHNTNARRYQNAINKLNIKR